MEAGDTRAPMVRSDGLIIERLPGELLVYDEERDEAHCLHAEAAAVFDLLDGVRTRADIAAVASEHLAKPVSEKRVAEVLAELDACRLLEEDAPAGDGLSRRDLIHRGALTGAGVAGAALITSIAAPLPAAAQSPQECEAGGCTACGPEESGCVCAGTDQGPMCLEGMSELGPPCETSADCDPGFFCTTDSCFDDLLQPNNRTGFFPFCAAPCGTVLAARTARRKRR